MTPRMRRLTMWPALLRVAIAAALAAVVRATASAAVAAAAATGLAAAVGQQTTTDGGYYYEAPTAVPTAAPTAVVTATITPSPAATWAATLVPSPAPLPTVAEPGTSGAVCDGRARGCQSGLRCISDATGGPCGPIEEVVVGCGADEVADGTGVCAVWVPKEGDRCEGVECRGDSRGPPFSLPNLECSQTTATPFGLPNIRRCLPYRGVGTACELTGPRVCGEAQGGGSPRLLCIDGTCQAGDTPSVLGQPCDRPCRDGTECFFVPFFPQPMCHVRGLGAGQACGDFRLCDFGAGLDCVDGSCAAKSVPLGGVCNPQVRGQCSSDGGRDASGGTRAGIVRCSFGTSPGNPSTARCLFTCDVAPSPGGPLCTSEWDVCGTRPRDQVRLIDGRCVLGEVRGDACTNPRSFSCGGPSTPWTCRPTDGDGGGSGTVPSPATPGICAVTGAVGDACDAASDAQCGDELSCGPDGVCVDGGVLPGGACARDADCSFVAGVPAACATGRGADTSTCRQWRGPFEACTGADARCWGGLACSEDADASVCINADGGGRLGSFCRTVQEDCVGLENAFCEASGWRGAVCKVRVGEGEVCDSLFNIWRVCADGLACMANGRPQGRCV